VSDTTHIAVLKVLGFTTTWLLPKLYFDPVWNIEVFERQRWELARNGQAFVHATATTEAEAWAIAPTPEYLVVKLLTAMTTEDYGVEFFGNDAHIICAWADSSELDEDNNRLWKHVTIGYPTIAEAIAALFVKVCEAAYFDGTQVQL